jgi:delta-aminolevulinic acid dehydratase/porphobilinogen synthase
MKNDCIKAKLKSFFFATPSSGNRREALREAALDEAEGADIMMVKPAGPYLDVIAALRAASTLPIAAYHVSGEYAMLKAACLNGWLDERTVVMETLTGIRRAGADIIFTYYARQVGFVHIRSSQSMHDSRFLTCGS